LHTLPLTLHAPDDPLTWDYLSRVTSLSTETIGSFDEDTLALNTNVNGNDTSGVNYASVSLERLARCRPALPKWVLTGILAPDYGIFREGYDLLTNVDARDGGQIVKAAGPGTLWISTAETKRLLAILDENRKDLRVHVEPMDFLFSEAPLSEERLAVWQSEAALFMRWGLLGPGRSDPALFKSFKELVSRARSAPVTEAVFRECFGFGYGSMETKLDEFLRAVLAKPTSVKWGMPSDGLPPFRIREATSDEIGRILGDWLRMKGDFMRESNPELSREFLYSAGKMLERTYRQDNGLPPDVDPAHVGGGSTDNPANTAFGAATSMKPFVVSAERLHDPRLLAVYGLYQHDAGDDAKAAEFLEKAIKDDVSRPKAYAVLAQLRYAGAQATPKGADGKLSAEQAELILHPLRTMLGKDPTSDLYELMVATWTSSDARPPADDVREIVRGVGLYPRDTDLAYNAAVLCSQSGFDEEARRLIDMGLVFTTHEANRQYFEDLRGKIGQAQPQGAEATK
ncbi:MAG TPA: hypothetical protein VFE25_09585, partial [Opitutaceae bacterium]|nr:hypothetical protein [Opitutaceae bacterium]